MSERLSIIIPTDLKIRLEKMKDQLHLDQSSLIRNLLHEAIQEKEIEYAIQQYQKGRLSLGEAVQLSGVDYWTFLDILHDRGIKANIDESDHQNEIQSIKSKGYSKFLPKK